jgi:hypothetical protein
MILKPIAQAMKAATLIPPALSKFAVPMTSSSSLHPILATIRGGAAAAAVVDLERVSLRLDGLDTYAVIASIVLGAVMDVYGSCETKNLSSRKEKVAQYIHAVSVTASVACGIYVIMVFSLFNLYAKTALGTGADDVYLQLLRETTKMRRIGFEAFVMSLVTFEIALVANFFLNFKGKARWIFSGLCALGTLFCFREWHFVMNCASKYIFT